MPDTVKVPILGTMSKGKAAGVVIGGGGVSFYLIYHYVTKQKKQQAAATAAAAQASAQAASGYGYGTTAAYGYGLDTGYPTGYYGYGASGGFNAGYYGYGTPYAGGGSTLPVANTTNAQWSQAAITQLSGEGYSAQDVSAALGAYLAGATVTPAQQTIIQSALGIEGYPPQSGTNGFPPSINVQGTTGGGTGGGQDTGGSVTTGGGGTTTSGGGSTQNQAPNVVGQRANQAINTVKAAGFSVKTSPFRNPLMTYIVTGQSQSGNSVTLNVAQHTY